MPEKQRSKRDELDAKVKTLTVELETSERAVAQLQEQMTKLKDSSMTTVADYKRRFDEMQRQTNTAVEVGAIAEAARRADALKNENRLTELNARHGERIKNLQEDLQQERDCNAQVLVIASGTKDWESITSLSVGVQLVKDLRAKIVDQERELKELRDFHTQMLAAENAKEEAAEATQ